MKEPTAPVGSSPVPAFLLKLWALLEDPSNSDVIAWNWNGQNFCILDDQRFSKEILPRYFKHNNLSSFIRQLNMYGFRKVMSLESGLAKPDSSTIEFQHPFFKKGKAELLENIKRKMSSTVKSEDSALSNEELLKVASDLQNLKNVQTDMNTKLENMRRENQALWKEVSALRRKHTQQQKLLTKVLQFILGLMRGNIVMGPKRKRPLSLDPSQSPAPKYSRHSLQFPEGAGEEVFSSQNPGSSSESTLEIHEIFSPEEGTSEPCTQAMEQSHNFTAHPATLTEAELKNASVHEIATDDSFLGLQTLADPNLIPSSSTGHEGLALDVVQENSTEDPDSVINSILNENGAVNSDLLDHEDIQDFLSCIDASLEELQSMLSRKKLNVDNNFIDELFKPDLSSSDISVTGTKDSVVNELEGNEAQLSLPHSTEYLNKDMQVINYTGNPVLSLFDTPSNSDGNVSTDPTMLLTTLGDVYPDNSEVQSKVVLGYNSVKEPNPLEEDFSGPQELLPIFVLSPVNKLIDEATEAESL